MSSIDRSGFRASGMMRHPWIKPTWARKVFARDLALSGPHTELIYRRDVLGDVHQLIS
jgi:hypothetical protein